MDWFNEMYLRATTALRSLRDREEGQGLVEYAVLLGILTVAVIATIGFLGGDVSAVFSAVETAIDGVGGA